MEKKNGGRKMIMMVRYDFTSPCTYDEILSAKRGDRVIVLYGELEWAYVIRDDGAEGFLPWSYLASPAKLGSRRTPVPRDNSTVAEMTNELSSLTVASTKDVQLSTVCSLNEYTDACRSDSDSTSMYNASCSPFKDNTARLGGYDVSTPRDARRRQAKPRDDIRDGCTSSGVSSNSDTSTSPTNSSPKCRLAFKPAASDSDSGCEQTTEDPTQTRPNAQTQLSPSIETFEKQPLGNYLVMFQFEGTQEDDLSRVRPGECVTALNKDDPDWYWMKTWYDEEGFVPSAYLCDVKGPDQPQYIDSYDADESALTEEDFLDDLVLISTPSCPTISSHDLCPKRCLSFSTTDRERFCQAMYLSQ